MKSKSDPKLIENIKVFPKKLIQVLGNM